MSAQSEVKTMGSISKSIFLNRMVIPNDQEVKYAQTSGQIISYNSPLSIKVRKIPEKNLKDLNKSKINDEQVNLLSTIQKYKEYKFIPLFQFKEAIILNAEILDTIEKIQQISETEFITFYPLSLQEPAKEYAHRLIEFKKRNGSKTTIPILDPAEKNLENLAKKAYAITTSGSKICIVNYRHYSSKKDGWQTVMPILKEAGVYVICTGVLPRKTKNRHCLLGAPFIHGVNAVCHALPWSGGKASFEFLEPNWTYIPFEESSDGIAKYDGKSRIEIMAKAKSNNKKYSFMRADIIKQANEFCKVLDREDLLVAVSSIEGLRYFAKRARLIQ
ncbi:MAG: hypothetical protein ABIH53_03105 [archaeon]